MPVTWTFRGAVLTLSVSGVVANREIEAAFDEALAKAPTRTGMRLLWDAREAQTPLTAEDVEWRWQLVSSLARRGFLTHAALLLRPDQGAFQALVRHEMWKALPSMQTEAFTDEAEALAWLER